MPGGSKYPGPSEALKQYTAAIAHSGSGAAVKGAKNPYTSLNGHMFSFLDAEGAMALRLSDALRDEFLAAYDSGPVHQYGRVMRGYVAIPGSLLRATEELATWVDRSHAWIATLPPK